MKRQIEQIARSINNTSLSRPIRNAASNTACLVFNYCRLNYFLSKFMPVTTMWYAYKRRDVAGKWKCCWRCVDYDYAKQCPQKAVMIFMVDNF